MKNLEITKMLPYSASTAIDLHQAGSVVQTGFGGRTLAECIDDATDHLQNAQFVQFARTPGQLLGFAMYEQEEQDLYLNGIVVQRQSQAKNLGYTMVKQAMDESQATCLYAVTRNPAILRIMLTVCDYVLPAPNESEGERVSHDDVHKLAQRISLPTTDLPYHRGRYPDDLYDQQPVHSNSEFQAEFEARYDLANPSDAIMLVGALDER